MLYFSKKIFFKSFADFSPVRSSSSPSCLNPASPLIAPPRAPIPVPNPFITTLSVTALKPLLSSPSSLASSLLWLLPSELLRPSSLPSSYSITSSSTGASSQPCFPSPSPWSWSCFSSECLCSSACSLSILDALFLGDSYIYLVIGGKIDAEVFDSSAACFIASC